MSSLKKALRSPVWLCAVLLGGMSASAQVTATATLSLPPTPVGTCSNLSPLRQVSASGNQLFFPVTGSYSYYPSGPRYSCSGNYIVTLSRATIASVQGPTCPSGFSCTYSALTRLSAAGNQITFPITGSYSYYPGGPSYTFNTSYVVTLAGASASGAQGPVSPSGYSCTFRPFTQVTASGNQITFPLSGSFSYYPGGPSISCTSSYVIWLY